LQNDSLNVQNTTIFNYDDAKYDDPKTMSIRELKKRKHRRLNTNKKEDDDIA